MEDTDIIKALTETEQRAKSNTRRIDRLEERVDKLEQLQGTVAAVQTELGSIMTTVREIRDDVKELQKKPGKRWETIVEAAIALLVGLALGALFK